MASALEFVIKARDEASGAIGRVSGQATDLRSVLSSLVTGGGPFGIITAAVVATTGAVVALSVAMAEEVERLDRVAKASGTTTENIQVLEQVFRDAGLSSEDAATSLVFMNRAIGRGEPLLAKLGITTRDALEATLQLGDAFAGSDDAAKKQALSLKLLGRSSAETVAILDTLRATVGTTRAAMQANGGIFSEKDKENARKLDATIDTLSRNWKGAMTRMQSAIAPWALSAVQAFNDVWDAITGRKRGPVEELERELQRVQSQLDANIEGVAAMRSRKVDESFIKEYDALIAKLKVRIETLKNMRAVALKAGALDDGAPAKGGGKIDGVNVADPTTDSRKTRLEEMQKLLKLSAADAERYLGILEALETVKKRDALVKQFTDAGLAPPGNVIPDMQEVPFDQKGFDERQGPGMGDIFAETQDAMQKKALETGEVLKRVADDYRAHIADVTSVSSIAQQGLEGLWNGLSSGFSQVFANMLEKGQTLRSAMKTIFKSLASEVLQILARIAAAKIFGFIMNLLFPGSGTAATKLFGGFMGGGPAMGVMAPVAPPLSALGGGGTVNIYALDRSGIEASLRDPRGSLRSAMRDAALGSAY